MFAPKQISLMALLIASAYAAPQLDLEENAKNINTGAYINVRDHPFYILCRVRKVVIEGMACQLPTSHTLNYNLPYCRELYLGRSALRGRVAHGVGIRRHCVFCTALKSQIHWERMFFKVAFEF